MERPSHGGNLAWAASLSHWQPRDILDFSASINPLGPPQAALDILLDPVALLGHYPDPSCRALRVALSNYHGIPADWILPGNGAAELLTWVGRDFSVVDHCALLVPGFNDYFRALNAYDVAINPWPIEVSSQGSGLSVSLDQTRNSDNAGCILNDPHNPSGKRLTPEFIQACLARFDPVVIDEAFLDFLPPEEQYSAIQWLDDFPQLVILRSLTKFYRLPGLRIGYAIAHPSILKRWQQWRDPWSVNALAIEMGAACVKDEVFQRATWDWLPEARSQLFDGLNAFTALTPLPSSVNFLLVKCDVSVTQLQRMLLEKHQILIRDCLSFSELGDHYFRVAVLSQKQNQRLIAALAQALSQLSV